MNPDTNNEVARLRELLNRAIEVAGNYEIAGLPRDGFMLHWKTNKYEFAKLKARLAPAPEEDIWDRVWVQSVPEGWPSWRELGEDEVIQEGDEEPKDGGGWMPVLQCYVGKKAKGRVYPVRTRRPLPVIQESLTTEPASKPTDLNQPNKENTPSLNEWRYLSPDEVIQGGDQYEARHLGWQTAGEYYLSRPAHAFKATRFRTRRPLPVKEEMPLDTLWTQVLLHRKEKNGDMADAFGSIYDCLRYLRDEIQKLKEAKP